MDEKEYKEKSLTFMDSINRKLEQNKGIEDHLNNLERMVEGRLIEIECSIKKYERFISETAGFFTRIGFYLDGIVIFFKMKFCKK
ncbi:MAG: hypothetical protein M0P12_01100 [Paludibacteraceae bacterium]|jgi:hypothetical protein|nr:hypothetical protein [Paludibacteraceae bacterium]MCK9616065.1 hypothetical protein [Candidatus Omnitrophota bacterium]